MFSMFYCEYNFGSYDLKDFKFSLYSNKKKNISGIRVVVIVLMTWFTKSTISQSTDQQSIKESIKDVVNSWCEFKQLQAL